MLKTNGDWSEKREQIEIAQATKYAETLAIALHKKHYSDVTEWKPLHDLLGLLTQIDNMVASLQNTPTCTNSQTVVWRNIEPDGLPPCNGEDWFLGANEQGAMCCFNFLDDTGMCWYCGPEDNAQLMDGLLWWAKVDAPDMTPNACYPTDGA